MKVETWSWMQDELVWDVPHHQVVFTIPKMPRIFLKYKRHLLSDLCLCGKEALLKYLKAVAGRELTPGIYPGTGVDNIEVTNGTSEANYIVSLVTLKAGDEMALQVPNYMQLWGVPRSLGAKINSFSLDFSQAWEPDWEEFEAAVNQNTRLVYISNPNNPSGSVLSDTARERIVARCEKMGTWLLSDEVYIGSEREKDRTQSFWGMSDRVIVTSGLSKAYGIPGIRIGWIVGPTDLITECWSQHDYLTIGPNTLSDIMAQTAVRSDNRIKLYHRTREILQYNYPVMLDWLESHDGFFSWNSHIAGAFCFVKYNSEMRSLEICTKTMENQSTLIVPGSHLGMEGLRRIGAEIRRIIG